MKLIFLDRDGVINEFPGFGNYVVALDQFKLIPSSVSAIAALKQAGYEINVISNQGCVSRKLITPEALEEITNHMRSEIEKSGGKLDGVFYCPHQTSDNCECRKPKTGLLKKAVGSRSIDVGSAYFIGDSEEDMQAGREFGCKTILVLSGRSRAGDLPNFSTKPDFIKDNLAQAVQWLLQKS